jgi:hypothetical protein
MLCPPVGGQDQRSAKSRPTDSPRATIYWRHSAIPYFLKICQMAPFTDVVFEPSRIRKPTALSPRHCRTMDAGCAWISEVDAGS